MDIQLTREQIRQRIKQIGREVLNINHAIIPTKNKIDENIESVREVRSEEIPK